MVVEHRVNLDFDQALVTKNKHYQKDKINHLFEYIYFILNTDSNNTLITSFNYPKEYLEYMARQGFILPKISTKGQGVPWWGSLENFEEKRKINSKCWVTDWSKNVGLCPSFVSVVKNEEELKKIIESVEGEKFYYRSEYGFSGKSNKVLLKDKSYKLRFPGTIAPLLNIELSLGVTVDLKTRKFFICKNNVDYKGAFCGGSIISLSDLAGEIDKSTEFLEEKFNNIFDELIKVVGNVSIEFDTLFYNKDGNIFWYEIVEINYRKTMGLVVKSLHEKFGKGKWIISTTRIESLKSFKELFGQKAILTSPPSLPLTTYYIVDED